MTASETARSRFGGASSRVVYPSGRAFGRGTWLALLLLLVPAAALGGTEVGPPDVGLPETGPDLVSGDDPFDTPDLDVPDLGPTEAAGDEVGPVVDAEGDDPLSDPEPDLGPDLSVEAGEDPTEDPGVDPTADPEDEVEADLGAEVGGDDGGGDPSEEPDAGPDAAPDAAAEAGTDAGADAAGDASGDTGEACGDETCTLFENCFDCPEDCGVCACDEFPGLSLDEQQDLLLEAESTPMLGTLVSLLADGELASGDGPGESCAVGLGAGGELTACATLAGAPEVCASAAVTGAGTCAAPADCLDDEPVFTCDAALACCQGTAGADAAEPGTWMGTQAVGALACDLELAGEVTGELSVAADFGPGCDCPEGQLAGSPSAAVAAAGPGACALHRFGRDYAVDVEVETCAVVELGGGTGCDLEQTTARGSRFEVVAQPLEMQWFRVNGYRLAWSDGIECP